MPRLRVIDAPLRGRDILARSASLTRRRNAYLAWSCHASDIHRPKVASRSEVARVVRRGNWREFPARLEPRRCPERSGSAIRTSRARLSRTRSVAPAIKKRRDALGDATSRRVSKGGKVPLLTRQDAASPSNRRAAFVFFTIIFARFTRLRNLPFGKMVATFGKI